MTFEALRENIAQIKQIIREMYIFTNHLSAIENLETNSKIEINAREKRLLVDIIDSLTNQLKILNDSIPKIIANIWFYKRLGQEGAKSVQPKEKLIQVRYIPYEKEEKISLTISDKDKKDFLENLSKSHLSIIKLKKKYAIERPAPEFGKPNFYAKLSNRFFRKISNNLVAKSYFNELNKDLRKINSPFVVGTYVSMILFSSIVSFIVSTLLLILLLFFDISVLYPFLTRVDETILLRFVKFFWIIFAIPLSIVILLYFYPKSEAKNLGGKIDQELPFVAIHMSAIATSGIEPVSIFKIILKNEEYKYSNKIFRKLMNLINFHGQDIVTALKNSARLSPSNKLRELLDGLATSITSGGSLYHFLDKHAEKLLFDYKLERERYIKASETFMDIYISVAIAAPMILLMLFVIMGSTGMLANLTGLSTGIINLLIILIIALLNIGFLVLLRLKQPAI